MVRSLLVLVIAAMSNLAAADVRGRWSGTTETKNGSRIGIVVTLNQHGQELSGSVATGNDTNPAPIEKAEVRGDTVTFEMHDDANRIVKFRLALTDGLMSGEISVGDLVSKVVLSPASDAGFYPIAGGLLSSPPLLLRKVEPGYTEEARAEGVQGTVVLQVEIDPSGKVGTTHIGVIRSLGLGLDEKAIEAVKQWKFKPAIKNGTPITAKATIEVNFRL
jgi:TonB family protein